MTRVLDNVSYVTQYVWDEANQVVETIYPSGRRAKAVRDTVGWLTGVQRSNASGGVITTYVANVVYQGGTGLLTQVTLGNNLREEYTYDSLRFQLTQKQVVRTNSSATLFSVTYEYQAWAGQAGPQAGNAGQVVRAEDSQQGTIRYEYDAVGRVTSEQFIDPWIRYYFTYDRWGNLTRVRTDIGSENFLESMIVETDGQGIPTNRYATVDFKPQVYDAAGQLTDDGTYLYQYDAAGRLREVRKKAGNVLQQKFWYDHAGRRVKKEDRPPGATAHWYYCLWSGDQVMVEYQTLVGTTFPPGTTPEQAAATDTPSDLRYAHWDLLSVRLVTDGQGNQVDTQSHDAYGGEMDGGGEVPPFFTTYEREQTGLDYAWARYYRSDHRRFTSPDSYRGSYRSGSPQSLNRYAYVGNDPINRVDPTGNLCIWVQVSETYGYYDCSILVNNVKQLEPVDPPPPPAGPCKIPSWDQLNQDIKRMFYNDERLWNGLSQALQYTVLGIYASMLVNGLFLFDGFEDLRIVGISNGVVRFSGAGSLEDAFRNDFTNMSGILWANFSPSTGFRQIFHGLAFGARSRGGQNSLHLTFPGNGILEAHIDIHGSGGKHFLLDGLFRGFDDPDPYKVWESLMKDDRYKDLLKSLMDCPTNEGGNPR